MSVIAHKLSRAWQELGRSELGGRDKALHLAELTVTMAGLSPAVVVSRRRFYELRTPPPMFRGLRDLTVRLGAPVDTAALCAVHQCSPALVAERFARGDLVFVGELDRTILAHAWFHAGPAPFGEDEPEHPCWAVPKGTYWSYHAVATPEARASGVFAKVFQSALRTVLIDYQAERVRGWARASNQQSISLHERIGFRLLGRLDMMALPGVRWLCWTDESGKRQWLQRRTRGAVFAFPPR